MFCQYCQGDQMEGDQNNEQVAGSEEMRSAHKILVSDYEERQLFGRIRIMWRKIMFVLILKKQCMRMGVFY